MGEYIINRHVGAIMEKLPGLERHCETPFVNSECLYLKLGCMGCTFQSLVPKMLQKRKVERERNG